MSFTQFESELGLPLFSKFEPETIQENVKSAIAQCKQVIDECLQQTEYRWDNLVLPIDEVSDQLSKYWSPVSHMNSVVSNDALREAHDGCLPLLSEYYTWMGQHKGLYKAYKQIAESAHFKTLNSAQQKVINDALLDFTLSGVALENQQKQRYAEIQARLSDLSSNFSNHVMDATLAFTRHITDQAELAGLPQSALDAAAQAAKEKELPGWLFTLDFPSYLPVMTYCENRQLREEMYRAFATRASETGPNGGQFDNTGIIEETLSLRQELAKLLDFDNYAEYSLATKMAESADQVKGFLTDLAEKSRPQAEAELQEIRDFAAEHYGATDIQAWDIGFYAEKLKQQKYAISDEMLRPYFPEDKVVSGLFEVVRRLYGIKVSERHDVETWHKDVRFFEITDEQGELRGRFYLDLYARAKKRGGAWMDECRSRWVNVEGRLQYPVAYLVCNFNGPVGDKPALFTHDEVITLFHEFGHGIHHMLTKVDESGVSGIRGVAWDAVELPSQFLENWCWEAEALAFISGHYETGEPLPQEMLDKLLAARNFQSAMQMIRQLEFSLFDFGLHEQYQPGMNVQDYLNGVRDKVAVVKPPEFNRFQNSFSHIFAGGYAAGYYSYKWAEVLSSDAYSRFEEEGIFNATTGASFLQNILEMGGSKEPMELFKAFRGREPDIAALLRHSGIAA
ncbi:oligopeptidase A [Planctobacterium marinum]|uniref:oligopeptidase A n=1 Tax=Planctobacterium marinum TaxID=1631968 RepID=UPI001E5B2946|nr:oligopeptidase A [Planctobacterium marinum]MCC2607079.1 oligopeptidase A [Planctobacterium marinum]